jgi:uncharacterized protein
MPKSVKKTTPKKPAHNAPLRSKKKSRVSTTPKPVPSKSTPAKTQPVPQHIAPPAPIPKALPEAYQDGRMALLTRDPNWLYCYWDLTPDQHKVLWACENPTLRLMEADTAKEVKRLALSHWARSWYIQVESTYRSYRAELGYQDAKGQFTSLIGSNASLVPRSDVSPATGSSAHGTEKNIQPGSQPAWFDEQLADRFYALSAGARFPGISSAEALSALRRQLQVSLSSEQLHSASMASESARKPGAAPSPDYWLIVDADLIVYGATVPGSKVTIQNVPVSLDRNGKFWARFALPDGTLSLPVVGVSPDQLFRRGAHIVVHRDTKPIE